MSRLRTANLLGALAGAISDRLEARLRSHPNQNSSAAAALNLIAVFEGCSNAILGAGLKLSHPATVRLVDKLEAAGLVESRTSVADRRAVALFLTPAGAARAREMLQQRCVDLEATVDLLSADQRRQLDGIAETLLAALTTTPIEGGHICRLCDDVICPQEICPVHQKAVALLATG